MKSLLLALVITTLRAYVGAGLYDRIAGEVARLFAATELSGPEKMSQVLAFATREALVLGETLVRAVAEIALLKLKSA